jgi:threonyl-tRNA synthetase
VDIDDRALTLQKKVREAEMEWTPYIIVVGKREIDSGMIPVRDRATGKVRSVKLNQLMSEIEKTTFNKPFKALPLPKYLSKRPQFHG